MGYVGNFHPLNCVIPPFPAALLQLVGSSWYFFSDVCTAFQKWESYCLNLGCITSSLIQSAERPSSEQLVVASAQAEISLSFNVGSYMVPNYRPFIICSCDF